MAACAGCGARTSGFLCQRCLVAMPQSALQHLAAYAVPTHQLGAQAEAKPPPHLTGKVIGFRAWTLQGYKLLSGAGEWTMGVNEAQCRANLFEGFSNHGPARTDHPAPEHHCTCGLHAWYSVGFLHIPGASYALGAVTAWGRIEAHQMGFRAQYAQPVVLAYHEQQPYKQVCDLKAIASEMGLECVPVEELSERAATHGDPVPEEMIPGGGLALPPSALMPTPMALGASAGALSSMAGFAHGGTITLSSPFPPPRPRRHRVWSAVLGVNAGCAVANATAFLSDGSLGNAIAGLVNAAVIVILLAGRRVSR